MNKEINILNLIRQLKNNNSLTKTQKKIADYILKYPGRTTLMSAEELSEKVDSSPSSVNRFVSKKLGFSYKEFKEILKDNITEESEGVSPHQETHTNIFGILIKYMDEKKFTNTQEQIAEFILNNPKETYTSTVKELANKLKISGSNFIKFANELNMDGFKNLQDKLKNELTELNEFNSLVFNINQMSKKEMYQKFDELNDTAMKKREMNYWINDYKLFNQNLNHNLENYYTQKPIILNFFYLINNASNIIIYDYEDITRHVLHKNLNRYGYINYFTTSEIDCLNQIDNIIKNSETRKERSKKILKKHADPDLANYFVKNIEGDDNLLIIHSTFKHNESVTRILKKAQDNNMSIILVESNTTKNNIGPLDNIDLRINIGKTIALNDDKDHRSIVNDIMFYELVNSQIRTYIKERKANEQYNVDELFNEDGY